MPYTIIMFVNILDFVVSKILFIFIYSIFSYFSLLYIGFVENKLYNNHDSGVKFAKLTTTLADKFPHQKLQSLKLMLQGTWIFYLEIVGFLLCCLVKHVNELFNIFKDIKHFSDISWPFHSMIFWSYEFQLLEKLPMLKD